MTRGRKQDHRTRVVSVIVSSGVTPERRIAADSSAPAQARGGVASGRVPGAGAIGLQDIVIRTNLTRRQALRVMDKLARQGYLQQIADARRRPLDVPCGPRRRNPTWKLVDPGLGEKAGKERKPALRDKIWRAARYLKAFSSRELAQLAGLNHGSVEDYLKLLEFHKVIVRQPNTGRYRRYVLLKDSGPQRPVLPERPRGGTC